MKQSNREIIGVSEAVQAGAQPVNLDFDRLISDLRNDAWNAYRQGRITDLQTITAKIEEAQNARTTNNPR